MLHSCKFCYFQSYVFVHYICLKAIFSIFCKLSNQHTKLCNQHTKTHSNTNTWTNHIAYLISIHIERKIVSTIGQINYLYYVMIPIWNVMSANITLHQYRCILKQKSYLHQSNARKHLPNSLNMNNYLNYVFVICLCKHACLYKLGLL